MISNIYGAVIVFGFVVNLTYSFNPFGYIASKTYDVSRYLGCSVIHCCDDDWTQEMVDGNEC